MSSEFSGIEVSSFLFDVPRWLCHIGHFNLHMVWVVIVVDEAVNRGVVLGDRGFGHVPADAEPG